MCGTLALGFCLLPQAVAQDLFVTSNRTVAGGNPINSIYSRIVVGFDGVSTTFPGIQADITSGSADFIAAIAQSLVGISGGTFGTIPTGGSYTSALSVQGGSTVNLSGGTFNSFAFVGPFNISGSLISTLNFSSGTITDVYAQANSIVNMTGGSISALLGNSITRGELRNDSNGTINLSGGSVDIVALSSFATAQFATTNISGGAIGSIRAQGNGFLNFLGSGLNVNAGAQYVVYNPFSQSNNLVRDYTVSGTLSSGTALNQTFTAAAEYTASGALLSFRGDGFNRAKDLFVQTDQTVNSVHNTVAVGYDETYSVASSPSVTFTSGADAANLDIYNASVVKMIGGTVHGYVSVGGTSQLTVTGGSIGDSSNPDTGIIAYEDSSVSVLGGTVNNVHGYDNSEVTIGGSAQVAIADVNTDRFTINGGSVQTVLIGAGTDTGTLTLFGGSVQTVEGYGGVADIRGGLAANAVLANIGTSLGYSGTDFNVYGTNLSVFNPIDGVYFSDFFGIDLAGVWWDLSGTLADGSRLSARYFDADGTTSAPARLNLTAAPEPGTMALILAGLLAGSGSACFRRHARSQKVYRRVFGKGTYAR